MVSYQRKEPAISGSGFCHQTFSEEDPCNESQIGAGSALNPSSLSANPDTSVLAFNLLTLPMAIQSNRGVSAHNSLISNEIFL